MTPADIEILKRTDIRETIERNLGADPATVALGLKEHGALISTQVKYLQRACTKLPSYYAARCIIPPLAYEQSSSEQTAAAKDYSGELCIDLTCGLGVDSFYLSRKFERVIAMEKDETFAEIASYNFGLLGVNNIEVANEAAEAFLQNSNAPHADLIYIDPARRRISNKKLVLFEDASPNVLALLPRIKQLTGRLVIKASPLFDVDEAFRLFGDEGAVTVEAVSWQGECKEVLIEINFNEPQEKQIIKATIAGGRSVELPRPTTRPQPLTEFNASLPYRYLLIPDVSLYKARMAVDHVTSVGGDIFSSTGYGFGCARPENFMGTVFEISETVPYQPRQLKKYLKERGIGKITVLKKDFPAKSDDIVKHLGMGYGEDAYIAFTAVNKKQYAIPLKKQ